MDTTEPTTRRWNVSEYYQIAELGLFDDQRVELIAGEVLRTSPQGAIHQMCIELVQEALRGAFGGGYSVRVQAPLRVSQESEPEPDLAVVPGTARDYPEHPTSALLVVEVSDSSLVYDRTRKASLYAAAQVPEYWVLDIASRRLEVFRDPVADSAQAFGYGYHSVQLCAATDSVRPLAAPGTRIDVAALLP